MDVKRNITNVTSNRQAKGQLKAGTDWQLKDHLGNHCIVSENIAGANLESDLVF